MRRKSGLSLAFNAIRDRNLYGRSFFSKSLIYLIIGLIIQYYTFYLLIPQWLIIYAVFYVGLVLISGAFAKNVKREFHSMAWWLAYLLFLTSVLSKAFAVIAPFENTMLGFLKRLLIVMISEPAFLISMMTIAVFGQRTSLRRNTGLNDNFFDEERNRWKKEVRGFPNLNKILDSLSGGRFVVGLFDKGLFNLTVLWSCNVIEEVTDAITEEIIILNSKRRKMFRKKSGFPLYYPQQLKNLGYSFHQRCHGLWEIRNKIAHRNYKPTFEETNEALTILILFARETPANLKKWLLSQTQI